MDYDAGDGDMVRAWVVYPERADKAPVVIVIHEIYALTDWIRGVADQLAAEGFIAIAPDLISGKGPDGGGSEAVDEQGAVALIRTLDPQEVTRRLKAAASYGTHLPSSTDAVGIVGVLLGGEHELQDGYRVARTRGGGGLLRYLTGHRDSGRGEGHLSWVTMVGTTPG